MTYKDERNSPRYGKLPGLSNEKTNLAKKAPHLNL
jgi:hypothetical protein